MVEAAWVAVEHHPHGRTPCERLANRIGKQKAIVAVARKLRVAIGHVLSEQEADSNAHLEAVARKRMTGIAHTGTTPGKKRDRLLLLYEQLDRRGVSASETPGRDRRTETTPLPNGQPPGRLEAGSDTRCPSVAPVAGSAVVPRVRGQIEGLFTVWNQQGGWDGSSSHLPERMSCDVLAPRPGVLIEHGMRIVRCGPDPYRALVKAANALRSPMAVRRPALAGAWDLREAVGRLPNAVGALMLLPPLFFGLTVPIAAPASHLDPGCRLET